MPEYTFECATHGRRDVVRPMADAGDPAYCPRCLRAWGQTGPGEEWEDFIAAVGPMRRIYDPQRTIIRPRGFNLRPGDVAGDGLGWDNFDYELERGELRVDSKGAYTPDSRAKREAQLAAEDTYAPPPVEEIDRHIPEKAHQNLHEWARQVYSDLEEAR